MCYFVLGNFVKTKHDKVLRNFLFATSTEWMSLIPWSLFESPGLSIGINSKWMWDKAPFIWHLIWITFRNLITSNWFLFVGNFDYQEIVSGTCLFTRFWINLFQKMSANISIISSMENASTKGSYHRKNFLCALIALIRICLNFNHFRSVIAFNT